jgi:mRNA-degrading endonuclease RelE of RelBE toxin-antitoxin system
MPLNKQPPGMTLVIERAAMRGLLAIPEETRASLRRQLVAIAAEPFNRELNDGPWKGAGKDHFKVRQGKWRACYKVDRKAQDVRVMIVDTRERVYQ